MIADHRVLTTTIPAVTADQQKDVYLSIPKDAHLTLVGKPHQYSDFIKVKWNGHFFRVFLSDLEELALPDATA